MGGAGVEVGPRGLGVTQGGPAGITGPWSELAKQVGLPSGSDDGSNGMLSLPVDPTWDSAVLRL